MQVEQVIAATLIAMQDPSVFAAQADSTNTFDLQHRAPYSSSEKQGFFLRGRKLEFSAVGRSANADSEHLLAYSKECAKFAKVFPGYPQPAFVTFSVRVSL